MAAKPNGVQRNLRFCYTSILRSSRLQFVGVACLLLVAFAGACALWSNSLESPKHNERHAAAKPRRRLQRFLSKGNGGMVPPLVLPTNTTAVQLLVSAFRDGERCARTLGWALSKAAHPDRVYLRVMQALKKELGDVSCEEHFKSVELPRYCGGKAHPAACAEDVLKRVSFWKIALEDGQGPAHQRGLMSQRLDLSDPEAFCLSTDSHMDFAQDWDDLTIQNWLATDNEFAVLSAYVMSMERAQEPSTVHDWHVDLCGYMLQDGIPRGRQGGDTETRQNELPYLTMNWAAGYSFHRCHAERNVPVDVNLAWIFTGEEINRAIRLWTNGYDLYLPTVTTVFHDYNHAKQEFWEFSDPSRASAEVRSRKRLESLMKLTDGPHEDLGAVFGVGTQRTLEQFMEWSRIDLQTPYWTEFYRSKGLTPKGDPNQQANNNGFCKTLTRVPVTDVSKLRASAQLSDSGSSEEAAAA
eukprot:TRINITY_DN65080_c0_g1_i1.p1 TRINITY_DN65080_c0_g1~~TRINITY_DN65080_c0_g1_i1.p1  ORF type:complete len:468 (+),score=88.29 TRINITY_DN65080_c0_g1_i1:198-1601(+)